MSVLSNTTILDYLVEGKIVIEPFTLAHLGTCSYDVTLGENFYRASDNLPIESRHFSQGRQRAVYNIYSPEDVKAVWSLFKARTLAEQTAKRWKNINPDDKVIFLSPGEMILAHTHEFIGGACDTITTMMKSRSSLGRSFIDVCLSAGWGDIPYFNRWGMEIRNTSSEFTIPLVVGRRIGQIVFIETREPIRSGSEYVKNGKYQNLTDINTLKSSWAPKMMLPKLWKD